MNILQKIKNLIYTIWSNLKYEKKGKNSKIIKPMRIRGKNNIQLGNNVRILNGARIETITKWKNNRLIPQLCIGSGTTIEQNCHIIAAGKLSIGSNCVFSAFVYISDCNHCIIPGEKIMESPLEVKKTTIGNGVFIGIGARIMPGVTLGNNCVVGANAVVTHDVPERAVVAGVPAKIIKYI